MKYRLSEYLDYIQNFERKSINIAFLFPVGRSGSILLQSLLDSHKEILMIPRLFNYYSDWNEFSKHINTPEILVEKVLASEFISKDWNYTNYLGENQNESFDLKKDEFSKVLLEILNKLGKIDRKALLLAIHFTYAIIKNINLDKIKCIFIHHHYLRLIPWFIGIKNENIPDFLKFFFSIENTFFESLKEDFPDSKLLFTVRNPFALYNSLLQIIRESSEYFGSVEYFYNLLYLITSYKDSIYFSKKFKSKFIKFEDIHLHTKSVMKDISDFLDITFSESMLKSTIDGKLWWSSPQKPINGPNLERVNDTWKDNLDSHSINLCSYMFKDLAKKFGYNLPDKKVSDNILQILTKYEFQSYITGLFKYLSFLPYKRDFIYITELYPLLRNIFINFSSKNNLQKMYNTITYNDVKFSIQYGFYPEVKNNNGYLIIMQSWEYHELPMKLVNELSTIADEIWVPGFFIRDSYIGSGVDSSRVKVVPYGVNPYIVKPTTSLEIKTEKSFKFICILNERLDIDVLIEAFFEEFLSEEDVCLVFTNLSEDLKNLEKINNLINSPDKSRPEVLLMYNDKKTMETINFYSDKFFSLLFDAFDCFVYPYKTLGTGALILEAMVRQIPMIITNGGNALDFCDNNNSYLIDISLKNTMINNTKDFNDSDNIYEYKIEKSHLKRLMRHVFNNQKEAMTKGKNARDTVLNNYTWEHTLEKINTNIKQLKNKPIIRFNIEKIKEKMLKESFNFYKRKSFYNSEKTLKKLCNYDSFNSDYLYNLGLVQAKLHKYKDAIDSLSQGLNLNKSDYEAYSLISYCLKQIGDKGKAEIYNNKFLEFRPEGKRGKRLNKYRKIYMN